MELDFISELVGIKVTHMSYGDGVIVTFDDAERICIAFSNGEEKKFQLKTSGNGKLKVATNETSEHKKAYSQAVKWCKNKNLFNKKQAELKHRNETISLFEKLREKYGFEGFVHYTSYDNLRSISNTGYLLSRQEIQEEGIRYTDIAWDEVLEKTSAVFKKCVRLAYGFNTPISYWFEKNAHAKNTEAVAIVVDPQKLLQQEVFFLEKSAAVSEKQDATNDVDRVRGFHWDLIFERGPMQEAEKDSKKKYRDAEVLVPQKVPISCINKIYFRSRRYLDKANKDFGYDPIFQLGKIGLIKHFSEKI